VIEVVATVEQNGIVQPIFLVLYRIPGILERQQLRRRIYRQVKLAGCKGTTLQIVKAVMFSVPMEVAVSCTDKP
jgi:hypothetical protein